MTMLDRRTFLRAALSFPLMTPMLAYAVAATPKRVQPSLSEIMAETLHGNAPKFAANIAQNNALLQYLAKHQSHQKP